MQALTPEAGDRRYFRPTNGNGWLHVSTNKPAPRYSTEWLKGCGVSVPEIGADIAGGYLVEDLGDVHLCHAPTVLNYRHLIEAWRSFSSRDLPPEHPNFELTLNDKLFRKELEQTHSAFFARTPHADSIDWEEYSLLASELAAKACAGPWCTQHRDFHSRNVLITTMAKVTIIDHQDMRAGPLFYDLASLWTDAYLELPKEVRALLRGAIEAFGKDFALDGEALSQQFVYTALQRVLKAVGTFAFLIGEGRSDYQLPLDRALARTSDLLNAEALSEAGLQVSKDYLAHAQKWQALLG